ncbi:MAG TPA: signal peptidase I [Candidatus Paceibacterota bacterium]|nr:signal peptidase I [Candidatus Paceibacterota bacterium]
MQSQGGGWLKDLFTLALLILIIVVPLRLFVISPFVVDGESMHPTFENLDYLIIDEITYRFEKPARGDVVVFRYPLNPSVFYIKRIIGLPGETVSISQGVTTITEPDGASFALAESYISSEDASYNEKVTLGPTEYFVMGDNRPNSSDSRVWGPLPAKDIVGRVLLRLLPVARVGVFPGEARYGSAALAASTSSQPQAP